MTKLGKPALEHFGIPTSFVLGYFVIGHSPLLASISLALRAHACYSPPVFLSGSFSAQL